MKAELSRGDMTVESRCDSALTSCRRAIELSVPAAELTQSSLGAVEYPAVTAIVPAYNEAASIADTIASLRAQTLPLREIIVVDDGSTDRTGDIASALGARVLRPPRNTGSKAGAQTFALPFVNSEFCMAIDADTSLAPDAVEKIMRSFSTDSVAASCGFVLPQHVRTIWERGRYIEYLFAFTFFKPVQDFLGKPLISSGCFSAYRTEALRKVGGWSNRTLAEDMDLTWTLYEHGYAVRFVPDAVCFPIEPHDLDFLSKQLRRWSHGFLQNLKLHGRNVIHQPYLGAIITVAVWDAIIASAAYLFLLPMLAVLVNPLFLLGYFIDLPLIAIPTLVQGARRRELGRVFLSLPCFVALRFVNAAFMLKAAWAEFVLKRPLLVYEKGH